MFNVTRLGKTIQRALQSRRRYFCLAAMLMATGMTAALFPIERMDLWFLDRVFKALRTAPPAQGFQDLVLIAIDEETEDRISEPLSLWHRNLGDLLVALAELKPRAVALDVVLPERGVGQIAPGYDQYLARSILIAKQAYPLVVGRTIDESGRPRPFMPLLGQVLAPEDMGFVLWPVDSDNVVRRFDERLATGRESTPTLIGQLVRKLNKVPGRGLIDFSQGHPLSYVPLHRLLESWHRGNLGAYRDAIGGKTVLIGAAMPFADRKLQPLNLAAWDTDRPDAPALMLHAQAFRSIMGRGLIQEVPPFVPVFVGLTTVLFCFLSRTLRRTLIVGAIAIVAMLSSTLWLLSQGFFMPLVFPLLMTTIAMFIGIFYDVMSKLRQRRTLEASLRGYVSTAVADEILSGQLDSGLQGRKYTACVMFLDMRGFTQWSERKSPEETIGILNTCYEELVACVHAEHGTVIDFMGDGMVAIFGAPNPMPFPAKAGVAAACRILAGVKRLNATLADQLDAEVCFGIGLSVGEVVMGRVGARVRHGYKAVGDVVNVAARLQALSKEVGRPIVCTEAVAYASSVSDHFVDLGVREIRGHSELRLFAMNPDERHPLPSMAQDVLKVSPASFPTS